MKKIPLSVFTVFVYLTVSLSGQAADRYWSSNGTGLGGAGTWDTTTANRFGTSSGGPFNLTWNNANVDSAIFSTNFAGGSPTLGAIVPASITVNKITVTNAITGSGGPFYSFSGASTITFSGTDAGIFLDGSTSSGSALATATNNVGITCKVAGSSLTKSGGGRISFNNTGNSIGQWIVNGGAIVGSANSTSAADGLFGTGIPATLVTNFITLNGGALAFTGGSTGNFSVGTNRGIYLGASGGLIGQAGSSTTEITINAPITGPGDLHFPGSTEFPGQVPDGNGIFTLSNPSNNYQGWTRIAQGEVRLGTNQALPITTTINITNGAINGRFNINGFTQTVVKVILDSTSGNSRISDGVGTGALYANEFELRRTGFSSASGASVSAVLAGTGILRKTTSGAITVSSVNTYTGNTQIEQGSLALTNSGSFDFSTNISIASGASLKVTNRVDARLNLGSAQTLCGSGTVSGAVVVSGTVSPGTNGFVGKLNVGTNTWNGGGSYKWEINKALGTAGTDPGWDQLNISGGLTIAATSGSPFTIYITSLTLANAAGSVSDFDNSTEYSWSIAKTTTGITGFDTNAFVLNTSGFVNSLGVAGVFRITTNATDILLLFKVEPVSQTITFGAQSNRAYGDSFNPGATASSGLPVSYSIVSGPASVLGNTVTVTGLGSITVRASQAGNASYQAATSVDRSFTANPAPLLVTGNNASRAYGSSNPTFTANYSGFKLSETLGTSDVSGSPDLTTSATTSSTPGVFAINTAVGNLSSSHYSLSFADGSLTVTQAVLTVTADNTNRAFNTANPAFTYVIAGYVLGQNSSVVTGTPVLTTTAVIDSNPGQYPIQVALGDLAAANYQFAPVNGTLTINGFPLTVTAVNTNRVYGATNPAFTVTYSGFVDTDDASVISGSPAFSTSAGTNSSVAGSPYSITPSIGTLTAARYSFTTFVAGELTITKAPLTVTAQNKSKAYGSANPTLTASYTGFVNNETTGVLTGAPLLQTAATTNSAVAGGPYEITAALGGLAAVNYSFGFASGQLTVTQASLTVTADNKYRLPGQANPTFTGVISGIQNGDNISATYSTVADTGSPEGNYAIVPALVDVDTRLGNYNTTTNNGILTVLHDPSILTQPASQTNVAGSTVTFNVAAIGNGTLQYQWTKGGVNLSNVGNVSGATLATLTLATISQSDAGSYVVLVTQGGETLTSSSATLTVIDPVMITADPASRTNNYGTTATFTVAATGTAPLAYQWKKGGFNLANGGKILGATTATLSVTNVTTVEAGSYSVVVSNLAGAVTSQFASLTVLDPAITTQPVSRTNNIGDNAQFTVAASGSGTLSYQWRFNGTDIGSGTASALNVSVASSANAGTYSVVVSNATGGVTSTDATLTVFYDTRTKITQWNFNSTTPDANPSTGVTAPSFGSGAVTQIGGVTQNQFNDGSPSDPASSGTDNASRRWNGFVATIPNKTGGAKYTVSTVGYQNIAFSGELWIAARSSAYWRGQYSTNGTDWVDRSLISRHSAALGNMFLYFSDDLSGVDGVANNANFSYRIVAEYESTATGSGSAAYVPADSAQTYNNSGLFGWDMVTVLGTAIPAPTISGQPQSLVKNAGETAVFNVTATSTGLSYRWKKAGVNLSDGGNISGSTSAALTVSSVSQGDASSYTVVVTNVSGAVTSDVATLTVIDPPVISAQPQSQTSSAGATVFLSVAANGTQPFTFQWKKGNSNLSNGGNVSGATIDTLTLQNVSQADAALYKVVVSNAAGDATSDAATLTIIDPPVITIQPVSVSKTAGETAVFSVVATGTSPGYQWKKAGVNVTNGGNISGANSDALTITGVSDGNVGSYTVYLTNSAGTATSSTVTLTVNHAPAITVQPQTQTNAAGDTVQFSVTATGTAPLNYQWKKGGVNLTNSASISGATAATLTVSTISQTDAGSYQVVVTNVAGGATSDTATLTVIDPPVITSQPQGQSKNVGQTATFTVVATGTSPSYQWYKDGSLLSEGSLISGSQTSSLTVSPVVLASAGSYHVVVTNSVGSATSSEAVLVATVPLEIDTQPTSVTNDAGTSATFTVVATGTGLAYQWMRNGVNVTDGAKYSGATTPSLTIGSLLKPDEGTFTVHITSDLGAGDSDGATLTVMDPAIVTQPTNTMIVKGTTNTLSVVATGTLLPNGALGYQWYFKANTVLTGQYTKLSGKTNATLTIGGVTGGVAVAAAGDYFVTVSNQYAPVTYPGIQPVGNYLGVANVLTSKVAHVTINLAPTVSNPASVTKIRGNDAIFRITGAGTGPLTYQWKTNGVALSNIPDKIIGADTAILTIKDVQGTDVGVGNLPNPSGVLPATLSYQCTVSNASLLTATSLNTMGKLTVTEDMVAPASQIAHPITTYLNRLTNGLSRTTNFVGNPAGVAKVAPLVTIDGAASDAGRVANVSIIQKYWDTNGLPVTKSPVPVELFGALPGQKKWTNDFILEDGTNVFTAVATDSAGNVQTRLVPKTYFLVRLAPLTVHLVSADGKGQGTTEAGRVPTLASGFGQAFGNGANLEIGRGYQIKAVPGQDCIVTNWTDGGDVVRSTSATYAPLTLTFLMQEGLVLKANFMTNPIIAAGIAGHYNGVFSEVSAGVPAVTEETSGSMFNVTVKTNRLVTVPINIQGKSHTLTGTMDKDGNLTKTIDRTIAGRSNLVVTLHLDWANHTKQMTGTISSTNSAGVAWSALFTNDLAGLYSSHDDRYTMAIPPGPGAPTTSPGGYGYALITNSALGGILFSGKTADGATFTESGQLSKDGKAPIHINMYPLSGVLHGWLDFSSGTPVGTLSWIKTVASTSPTNYQSGFTNLNLAVLGSLYEPNAYAGSFAGRALAGTAGTFSVSDCNVGTSSSLSWAFGLSAPNLITRTGGPATNSLTGSIAKASGLLSVTFRPTGEPATGVRKITGVVLQSTTNGFGAFNGNASQTGSATLSVP